MRSAPFGKYPCAESHSVTSAGGRAATSTFIQRNIGDVLVTFENEADLIAKEKTYRKPIKKPRRRR